MEDIAPQDESQGQRRASQAAELAAYRDTDGNPRLRKAAVLFLDQLGTKDLVENEPEAHLLRTHEAVRLARRLGDLSDEYQVARWFSDNLLLAVRINDRESDHGGPPLLDRAFGILVINAAWLQLALIIGGIASRGGIDVGPFYADEEFLYGPALNRAYLLESLDAQWPRIVLGDAALARMKAESATGDMGTYRAMLVRDEDERIFVNYLGDLPYTWEELDETLKPLQYHRELISAKLVAHKGDTKLEAKYTWMAAFHNWTVQERLTQDLAEPLLLEGIERRDFARVDYEVLGLNRPPNEDPRFN